MKIEAGKRYVRRDGSVTGIVATSFAGCVYERDKKYIYLIDLGGLLSEHREHPHDLVAEYVEEKSEIKKDDPVGSKFDSLSRQTLQSIPFSNSDDVGGTTEEFPLSRDDIERIQQERENDYGDAAKSHANIAEFWNAYLSRRLGIDVELDEIDAAIMLALMKVSRTAYKRKPDSVLDFASYANFALKFMKE